MTAHSTTPASTARAVDVHALPAMLTALRLPSFHRHWPMLAERADGATTTTDDGLADNIREDLTA